MVTTISLICPMCNNEFKKTRTQYNTSNRRGHDHLCSKICSSKFQTLKGTARISCSQCNTLFIKINSEIKKSKSGNHFCSKSCAATYNNRHKTYGIRRSKLEMYIEEQIKFEFPDLYFLANSKTAIESELDFFFPNLNLAIELNGILHYKPIYGQNKLDQIISNDQKKIIKCSSLTIKLIQYKYTDSYLNEKVKLNHWNNIKKYIIDMYDYDITP